MPRCPAVVFPACYYRSPRRLPREDSAESEKSEEEPRKRDIAIFLICLVFFAIILFVGSYVAEGFGLPQMALSIRLVAAMFTTVTVGTCATVGIGYLLTGAFLKHEFKKRFKKMDEEQELLLQRMTGQPDGEKED